MKGKSASISLPRKTPTVKPASPISGTPAVPGAPKRATTAPPIVPSAKFAKGGFVPFGFSKTPAKGKRNVTSGLPPPPEPAGKKATKPNPFAKAATPAKAGKAKSKIPKFATSAAFAAAVPKGQRVDITKSGVVKKYKGGPIKKLAEGGAVDDYVDKAKKLAGSAYDTAKSAVTDNPVTRAGERARKWWDTPAPAEYSEQGQRQGVGLDLETKDVPTVKPPKTAPAPGLAPGYKGKDAPKTDYEGKHDNTYLETFGSKKNIGYNPARRGERTGNWLMDERKGLNYPETIGNVHRFDRDMAEGAKKYGTPESEAKWRKDASKSGQEYWDLERAERETGRGRGTTGGEKAGERAAYEAKKRKDTPYAKGGKVKLAAGGPAAGGAASGYGRLAAEAPASTPAGTPVSKGPKVRKMAKGGSTKKFAEGGSVGLLERLRAGNIDDPSSEAYHRWGKGARNPEDDARYAALEAAAATPPSAAPAAAATPGTAEELNAVNQAMGPAIGGQPLTDQPPRPAAAKPKPRSSGSSAAGPAKPKPAKAASAAAPAPAATPRTSAFAADTAARKAGLSRPPAVTPGTAAGLNAVNQAMGPAIGGQPLTDQPPRSAAMPPTPAPAMPPSATMPSGRPMPPPPGSPGAQARAALLSGNAPLAVDMPGLPSGAAIPPGGLPAVPPTPPLVGPTRPRAPRVSPYVAQGTDMPPMPPRQPTPTPAVAMPPRPTQPPRNVPPFIARNMRLSPQEILEQERMAALGIAPPQGGGGGNFGGGGASAGLAKGGAVTAKFAKGGIVPATKNPGPAKAAERSKVPTFGVSKPVPPKPRTDNPVTTPFGSQHATDLGKPFSGKGFGSGPVAQRGKGPVRKKFI